VRFHLIDRVDAWEPAKSVRARKLTSLSEDYWEDHGKGPVMPPPFALEALCQAGTWLVMITTERKKRAALLSIGSVSFLRDVRPGDVLTMEGEVDSMSDEVAVVSGRVTVDGEPVLEAGEIMCALIDADDLANLDDTERLQKMLTRVEDE
jgi:3-hydroxyacyl-[acyl-carrier-protein] dehydratase